MPEKKLIKCICHYCAEQLKSPYNKGAIGMREGACDVCGETLAVCDAYHDYGINEDGSIISEESFKQSNCI